MIEGGFEIRCIYVDKAASEALDAFKNSSGEFSRSDISFSGRGIHTDLTSYEKGTGNSNYLSAGDNQITMGLLFDDIAGVNAELYLEDALEIVELMYEVTRPKYVYGISYHRREAIGEFHPPPVTDESLANDRIEVPTWLMVFSPPMVEEYGREWLLDLPAERIEELDDGAVMVVAAGPFPAAETGPEVSELLFEALAKLDEAFDADVTVP